VERFWRAALLVGVLASGTVSAEAQEVPRWELGPMFNLIKIQQLDSNRFFGFGARGVLNFSDVFGADVQFARNTHNESFAPSNSRTTYSADQFTVNLKATWRRRNVMRMSPFAIAGVGLARNGVSFSYEGIPGSFKQYQNKFALRFGGGLEFSPNRRFSVRLDASDLSSRIPGVPPAVCISCGPDPDTWWNRLDVSFALMMHLGAVEKKRQ
jgi:opacity protein-like surface antigen